VVSPFKIYPLGKMIKVGNGFYLSSFSRILQSFDEI